MFLLSSLDWRIINWIRINIFGFLDDSKNIFILCVFSYVIVSIMADKHKKKMKRDGREVK